MVFFFQAEDAIRDLTVTGVQTCALPICPAVHIESWQELRTGLTGRCPSLLDSRQCRRKIEVLITRPLHDARERSEEHTSELQSQSNLVCRLLLEKKKTDIIQLSTLAARD